VITLRSAELLRLDLRLRLPFRYGIVTLTEVPQIITRLTFDLDGRVATGLAADILAPKWFTKDPARAIADEIDEMLDVIRAAARHAAAVRAPTAFAFWRELYAAQAAWGAAKGLPPLLTHFGTSFVERALLHAQCRAHGATLSRALRDGLAGVEPGAVHAALRNATPRDFLPAVPSPMVFARHTIGLGDPIEVEEVTAAERPADGLPVALDEAIRAYGLRHFKIKINGEAARDRDRLARIARVLARAGTDFAFSLDGNETWKDVASFRDYYLRLRAEPALVALWPRLLYVEQPWHRAVALSPAIGELARAWPDCPPIIIDESDAEIGSLPAALALGYAGTSHKNCKGVFKSVLNAGLLASARAAGRATVLSGEDLCSVGPFSPLPDLAAAAALGVTSVERNGHHYYTGLAQFPPAIQEHALRQHSDLYVRSEAGWPRLEIRDGRLALGSVNAAPFGIPGHPDLSALAAERVI
jgi:L-alanine-DL-glutamate epimerase-like enolase superfamily enzyme